MMTNSTGHRAQELAEGLEAAQVLREMSTDGLLTSYAALTHRIHAAKDAPVTCGRAGDWEDDLRAQRDLIRAEILRRTGDL